jgi:hypothetical protein
MSRWLTSVVAKIKKLSAGRAVARPQWLAHLGVESLGGGSSLGGGRRMPVRPEVEQLEERRLMSSSGVISAITDNSGRTTVFELSGNGQVYEYNPAVRSSWFQLEGWDSAGFRQISAGLDAYGRAVCYAIHNGDNYVWEMDNYSTRGFTTESFQLAFTASQISATRNNECFGILNQWGKSFVVQYHADVNHGNGWWYTPWNGPWGSLVQITTGTDRYGNDEVYLLNGSQQVYRLDNGTYWLLPMHATQISAGAGHNWTDTDLFYIDPSTSYAYHYDGSNTQLIAMYVSQISAGLDQYGNEVLYSIDMYYHGVRRNDLSGNVNGEWEGGNVSQISAAGNDMVFGVAGWGDGSVWVFDRDWSWGNYWAATNNWGSGGWHSLGGWAASPYYAPLAA